LTVAVTDSNGNNVQGAVVKLFSGTSYRTLVGEATTSSGGATFADLPPGDYSYQVIFGSETINKTVTISEAASQSSPVSLSTAVQPTAPSSTNYLLYAGIAVAVIIVIAIAVLALRRRPLVSQ